LEVKMLSGIPVTNILYQKIKCFKKRFMQTMISN
jgi:hypothetical protein